MIEKVNKFHPDKVADRIAGALVDLAYTKNNDPRIAVEVLIGHNLCTVIIETDQDITEQETQSIVERIAGKMEIKVLIVKQDIILNGNSGAGDNGIFLGIPQTEEEKIITEIAKKMDFAFNSDGKYIIDGDRLIICQSNATDKEIEEVLRNFNYRKIINPLGEWTGGTNVDTGCTNRKLGSDLGHSVTGGGINGKDVNKADVCLNIYCFLEAQKTGKKVEMSCAIGDKIIGGKPFEFYKQYALDYINSIGGFEKLSEYGLQ